jgi:hypothetical protein
MQAVVVVVLIQFPTSEFLALAVRAVQVVVEKVKVVLTLELLVQQTLVEAVVAEVHKTYRLLVGLDLQAAQA